MTAASSSTIPFSFGSPPRPTVISLGSSVAVHVYRDEIDAAAKAAGRILKTDIRALFKGEQKSIEDDD